jgi:hypothetical protein
MGKENWWVWFIAVIIFLLMIWMAHNCGAW